jgi:signal transduction histidine kinase
LSPNSIRAASSESGRGNSKKLELAGSSADVREEVSRSEIREAGIHKVGDSQSRRLITMFGGPDGSIPKQLTWMNMLVSSTALLLASTAFLGYDLYNFRAGTLRNLGIEAQLVGTNSISALMFDDPSSAESTLSALRAAPHVISAEIYTPEGRAFAGYRRDHEESLPPPPTIPEGEAQVYRFQGGEVRFVRLIMFHGRPVATVYMRSDLGAVRDRVKNFALIVGTVFLMSLVAAMWMSSHVRRSIAGPIVSLAETAQMVLTTKDYSVRAPGYGERNEIAVLISSFNEMLAQIQERDAALGESRDRLEQKVQARTAQLTALNAELEAFSYSVSHDLRAPLRHVSGFSQILKEEYGPAMDPAAQGYLEKIQDATSNMGRLIEALLKMAQISRKELVSAVTDLNLLVREVIAELQPELEGRRIEWQLADLPSAECDSYLLKQVFANLISNAVKYTRRREVAIIEIAHVAEQDAPVFFIRDNGAGFDEKYADKLFGVFQRLHNAKEFEGTGVGLSTVQRIIRKHGGEIWAKGELNQGATFFFSLQARSQEARSPEGRSQEGRLRDTASNQNLRRRPLEARAKSAGNHS